MHEHDIFNLDISRQLLDYAIKIAFGVVRWCVLIWSPYEGDGHSRTCCVNVIVLWATVYKNWPYCTYTHFGEKPPLNQWTVWDPGFLFFGFFFLHLPVLSDLSTNLLYMYMNSIRCALLYVFFQWPILSLFNSIVIHIIIIPDFLVYYFMKFILDNFPD